MPETRICPSCGELMMSNTWGVCPACLLGLPHHAEPEPPSPPPVGETTLDGELPPGTLFGDYEIQSKLGSGGMGVVYKAWHLTIKRSVALKMLRSEELDEVQIHRFESEVVAAAKLNHPGVAQIYDSGKIRGRYFYSMAYVEGSNLSEWVKESGKPKYPVAAEIIRKAALALYASHELGIVHRDIKPSNIMVDSSSGVNGRN